MKLQRSAVMALVLATRALAAEPPAPGSVTADTIARSALLGFKLAMEDSAGTKPSDKRILECARAYDQRPLAVVFQTLLSEDLNSADLAELDRFFSSATGKKYERIGQLGIYTANGKPLPEPKPELTQAEYAELEAFSKTPAGNRYIYGRWVDRPAVQAALQQKLREMFRDCRPNS